MKTGPYVKELSGIVEGFDKQVEELGERIRTEIIVPLCKKHNLEFTSGMGRFFFSTPDGKNYEYSFDLRGKWIRILRSVLELLNQEVTHGQYLGYYVGDVRKE